MKRALIIDNDRDVHDLLTRTLQSEGIETQIVGNFEKASALIAQGKFDLVFLDLHIGNGNSVSLLQRIGKEQPSSAPTFVLLSDDQRPSALSIAFEAGASFFLYKPIGRASILKLLRAAQTVIERRIRQTRRVSIQVPVVVDFGDQTYYGETVNMSLSGVMLRTNACLPVGSVVQLFFQLAPDAKPVIVSGKVVRIGPQNALCVKLAQLGLRESESLEELLLPLISEVAMPATVAVG